MAQKRVVIKAAASGIGLAIAQAFATNSASVHICDINQDALHAVTEAQLSITGTVCDMSDRSAAEQFVQTAAEVLGGIDVLVNDVLVNNAGISGPAAPLEGIDADDWVAVLAVNLTGSFNVARLATPYRKQSQVGIITILSSLGGRVGYPNRNFSRQIVLARFPGR